MARRRSTVAVSDDVRDCPDEDLESFGGLLQTLQDMLGLPPGDSLLAELAECERTLQEASAKQAQFSELQTEHPEAGRDEDETESSGDDVDGSPRQESLEDVMRRLSLSCSGNVWFMESSSSSSGKPERKRIGVINTIRRQGIDHSLQVNCQCGHGGRCKMLIDLGRAASALALRTALIEWLAGGLLQTAEQHHAAGVALRRSLGVRVRS